MSLTKALTFKYTSHTHDQSSSAELLVTSVDGPVLSIPRVNRHHMGAYLCIASNGIRPSKSKRIELKVQCEFRLTYNIR